MNYISEIHGAASMQFSTVSICTINSVFEDTITLI